MNQSLPQPSSMGSGFLVVQVTTANGSIPLSDAAVTIRSVDTGEKNVLFELRSGMDGRTERVPLPAPPRAESLNFDNPRPPFSLYSIEVSLPQYQAAHYDNVPVFDGITAIQQANLAPLPDNGYPDGLTLNNARPFDGTAMKP